MSSKHILLSFKPKNHLLIKGSNKQKTNLLFLRFDILSLSKILSFTSDLKFSKTVFTNFGLLITWQSFLKLFRYINNYLNYNIMNGQTL